MGVEWNGVRFDGGQARFLWLLAVFGLMEPPPLSAAPHTPKHAFIGASNDRSAHLAAANTVTFSAKNVDAFGGGEVPLSIQVPSAGELRSAGAEEGAFLLLRNLPEGVSVSAGMAMGRVWVVPLREVAVLRLICRPGIAPFRLGLSLMGPNQRVLAETAISVTLHPPLPPGTVPTATDATRTPAKPEPLTAQAEAVMLARGKEVLLQGGIAAARIIFEELATHGSAAGALALAQSYDPVQIAKSNATGAVPDISEARKWYERAAELGNADAKRRLAEFALSR